MCLRLEGLLLKSQPNKRVIGRSQRLTRPPWVNFFAESAPEIRAAKSGL
jgi:hypothetical protein